MPPTHAAAFARARGYDAHAIVQRQVAAWLAERIATLPTPQRTLEIGCGTGFLRASMTGDFPDWLATDIAPAMLARAEAGLSGIQGVRFAPLDAEYPLLEGEQPFDLIAGSLVVQWFDDLAAGLTRLTHLLRPGGRLIVTTLAAGSFAEWRAACIAEGQQAGVRDYPAVETLAAMRIGGKLPTVTTRTFTEEHPNARAFLHALKAIGAGTPRAGYRPLVPAVLRRILARYEAQGSRTTYQVAMIEVEAP